MPSVSVVMSTFQRVSLLPRVLAPLTRDEAAFEIVVVVDGCRDGSLELLQRSAEDNPRLRPVWTENRGMVGARVYGAEHATGEIVLLLDDDVELAPGAIARHAEAHRGRSNLVAVGAMPVSDERHHSSRDYPRVMYAREYRRHVAGWARDPGSVLATLWEGHLSLRRDALLALAPPRFPEIGRAYHCDVDFGLRCEAAGLIGEYLPQAHGVHHFSRTPAQFLGDARSSGRGLLLIHAAHPDRLGPFRESQLIDSLPAPARPVATAAAARPRFRAICHAAVAVLGSMRLYRAQRLAAAVVRVSEQLREVRSRSASRNGPQLP